MDRKYLQENNLMDAHKQFMRLCEWSYVKNITEDDEEDGGQPQGNDPSQMGDTQTDQMNDMGGDQDMNGDNQNMGSNDQNMGSDAQDMGGDPNSDPQMGSEMPQDDQMGSDMPMGSNDIGGVDDVDNEELDQEDDDVIDVDDITNAQEKMNKKVNVVGKDVQGVEGKIEKLVASLKQVEDMINANNARIESFKKEFEKRNPTETEKLNLRSLDSYPYNISPQKFWDEKSKTSNYSVYSDNEEPTTKEYVITNSDVDDFDERTIEDSFKIGDDLDQDIAKIFGI